MEPTELFKLAEGIVILASLMALAYSVFKSKSTESTVREQSELIKIQGDELSELRTQRSEDSRRIKELESSLNVLQTIPLQKIAEKLEIITSNDEKQTEIMQQISEDQKTIAGILRNIGKE